MKGFSLERILGLLVFVPLLLAGCDSSNGSSAQNGNGGTNGGVTDLTGVIAGADGFAQKGPFQLGGVASIQALAEDGTLQGEPVQAEIGVAGEFKFDAIDWFGPSLITVSGDWFNESAGNFAGQPLTLRSVVAIPDPDDDEAKSPFPTSVNLLTEAMTDLVLSRLADDSSFSSSVALANRRLNAVLDFEGDVRDLNLFVLESQHPRDR